MSNIIRYPGLNLDKHFLMNIHIHIKKLALNVQLRSLNNKHTKLKFKVLMYKTLLKSIWIYDLQLCDTAKVSNNNKIQKFQNIALSKITNALPVMSNYTLHKDLTMKTVTEKAAHFYKPTKIH